MDDKDKTHPRPDETDPEATGGDPQAADLPPDESAEDQGAEKRKQHDLVLKTVFRRFFGDLVEIVEPGFAARVDLTSVEFLETETFSDFPEGTRRQADLVARLTSRDGEGRIVLVQTEIEGRFRSAMDERGFYYYLYLRGKYRLPVLLVVVFLQGGRVGLTMRQFVDRAEGVEVCRFRYVAFFPGQNRAEDFVERPQPLAPALAALMKSDWDRVQRRLRCMEAIRRADIDNARRFLLARLVEIYVELDDAEAERYHAELDKQDNEEVREMVITWEETLAASKAEGEARGEARGEAKGLVAMRNSVIRVLNRRLGSVPAFVRHKLDGIDSLERLEEILDQALTVSSVDELVFDPEPSN
jgi:hypothetical protein